MIDVAKLTVEELLAIRERLKELGLDGRKLGRPALHDYANWDWTKSNHVLTADNGVTPQTVWGWRKALNKDKATKYYPACLAWDWSKSNTEISRENRVTVRTVANYRIKLGKDDPVPTPVAVPVAVVTIRAGRDWSKADWSKIDRDISKDIGVSREMVRQRRAQLGLPKVIWSELLYQKFVKVANGATQLSFADVKKLMSISAITFAKYCALAGIKRITKYRLGYIPWHLMNQQLPNILLTEIWRLKRRRCGTRRYDHNWPKAAFHCVGGSIPDEWRGVVDEERAKAETYFQKPRLAGNGERC